MVPGIDLRDIGVTGKYLPALIGECNMPKKIVLTHPEGHADAGKPTGVIQFTFEDETVQTIDINSLSDEMKFRLMVHGASQKIGDSYAGAKAEPKPVEFAKQAVGDTIKQLVESNWRVTAAGGPRVTDLATVYAQVSGESIEAAVELVGSLDEAGVKELRNKPKIKAGLLALAAKRAAEKAAKAAEEAAKAE